MAEERAALDAQAQRIQAENYQLLMDQNASNKVFRRRLLEIFPRGNNKMVIIVFPCS